jgi:hypothetical protein
MKKIGLLGVFLLIICSGKTFAQAYVPSWGGGSDLQDLSFGFMFQYIESDFKIVKNPNWRDPYQDPETHKYLTGSLNSINSNSLPGFGIGFITRYSFNQYVEVRTTPSLVFSDKLLSYTYPDPSQNTEKQINTTSFDIPLLLKIKSDRIADLRMYVIGGLKYSHSISKKPNTDNLSLLDKPITLQPSYTAYEVGVGCDIYFEYFKLSPELKLSNSFGNVLKQDNLPYSSPISKLFLHTISISLCFE